MRTLDAILKRFITLRPAHRALARRRRPRIYRGAEDGPERGRRAARQPRRTPPRAEPRPRLRRSLHGRQPGPRWTATIYDLLDLLDRQHGSAAGSHPARCGSASTLARLRSALVDQYNPAAALAAQRRASLRSQRPALQPLPRPRPAIFLRLFPAAATRRWRRRRLAKKRHIAAKLCSTGRTCTCSTSAAAGAAWR